MLATCGQDVTIGRPNKCTLPILALGSRNSDARHRCNDVVLFYGLADGLLEGVEVHVASLLHDLGHPCLALLKRLERIRLRSELLAAAAHATTREVDLAQRVHPVRVLL